ncbi:MAG: type III pantothenate kinase [Planctomycetota bacterium]|nr:type III pantothenate kinase [Planctomycetota bacterium]
MNMLLAIDIGNTNTDLGIFKGSRLLCRDKIPTASAMEMSRVWRALRPRNGPARYQAALVASVNPRATRAVAGWARHERFGEVAIIGKDLRVPITVRVRRPSQVGADRLLDCFAALRHARPPFIVVDAGSAVTVDAVSQAGEFLGGAIAPGIRLGAEGLHRYCAQLPLVETAGWIYEPRLCARRAGKIRATRRVPAIGRDTVAAMKSGLFWGTVGLVQEIIERIESELHTRCVVIGTGGDIRVLARHLRRRVMVVQSLTLEGIVATYHHGH